MSTTSILITMSERSPVRIEPEDWPIIAQAQTFNGAHECQANYVWRIKVREHRDGRRLVYGSHRAGPGGVAVTFRETYCGFLVDASEPEKTVRAIRRVAGLIGDAKLGDECIADLPAEQI